MIIAIDYDGTYTTDHETWNKVIHLLINLGHTVICVTGREDIKSMSEPVMLSVGRIIPVVFAGKEWKREAALKKGYKVDVWIDDTPEMIGKQFLIGTALDG